MHFDYHYLGNYNPHNPQVLFSYENHAPKGDLLRRAADVFRNPSSEQVLLAPGVYVAR
jgi:hypothetical protein